MSTSIKIQHHLLFQKECSDTYTPIRQIGRGFTAFIYHCQSKTNHQHVAIKCFFNTEKCKETYRNEISILEHLKGHPMIPVIVDKHEGNVFFYATEYKGEMDLFDYIKHYISKTEPDINLIYQIFLDVCQAVKYIHSKNVIHRDLKLDNIIIQPKTHQILLIDWGLAEKKPYSNAMCGSYDFVAPEVVALNVAERYTGPSNDIWALGVIFIGMITGLMPWTAIEHSEIIKQIRTFNIYYPETLTKDQITFLRHIFVDHKRRYTIDDIINHDLFKITS